jgi:hypothetical protein
MNTSDKLIIELSKTKIILIVLGAAVFAAIGLWMLSLDHATIEAQRRFNSPAFVYGAGYLSIVFFGLIGVIGVKKFFDKKPGLVFTKEGVVDNSSGISAGFIPWSEIVGVDMLKIQKQKLLVIRVRNPEKYIEIGGPIKRALNKVNTKMCGSPIAITSSALKMSFEDLVSTFQEYLSKYGKNAG